MRQMRLVVLWGEVQAHTKGQHCGRISEKSGWKARNLKRSILMSEEYTIFRLMETGQPGKM